MIVILWEFIAAQGREVEFEQAYGSDGAWAELFRRGDGFLGTELLRDESTPRRYVTLDRWESQAAFDTFKTTWHDQYEALDQQCANLTEQETLIGSFTTLRTP